MCQGRTVVIHGHLEQNGGTSQRVVSSINWKCRIKTWMKSHRQCKKSKKKSGVK